MCLFIINQCPVEKPDNWLLVFSIVTRLCPVCLGEFSLWVDFLCWLCSTNKQKVQKMNFSLSIFFFLDANQKKTSLKAQGQSSSDYRELSHRLWGTENGWLIWAFSSSDQSSAPPPAQSSVLQPPSSAATVYFPTPFPTFSTTQPPFLQSVPHNKPGEKELRRIMRAEGLRVLCRAAE